MFEFWKRNEPSERQIEKAVNKLTQPHGEQGPRIESAEKLAEWGTPEALFGLLKRFTVASRVITEDIDEKRMVVRMLVEKGPAAVGPIIQFLKTYHHGEEWAVQVLSQILPSEEFVRKVVDVLREVGQSVFTAPEHRVSLVRAIHGHVTPEVAAALREFLTDADDDVRIASVEALAEVGEEMREPLLEAFISSSDRPRIRNRIAEIFADREWPVRGYRPKVEENLPEGFHLTSKGVIRRR